MKFVAVAVASLASFAAAMPADSTTSQCTPATYRCDPGSNPSKAWDVCNTSHQWVFAGNCPPNTVCKFLSTNGSPYCVPPSYTIG